MCTLHFNGCWYRLLINMQPFWKWLSSLNCGLQGVFRNEVLLKPFNQRYIWEIFSSYTRFINFIYFMVYFKEVIFICSLFIVLVSWVVIMDELRTSRVFHKIYWLEKYKPAGREMMLSLPGLSLKWAPNPVLIAFPLSWLSVLIMAFKVSNYLMFPFCTVSFISLQYPTSSCVQL